ncbi:MAG TPA: translation initiation factor IF-2 [Solirubrobacteraceae bacterium]|jgi:translation initiation factor IF-2|nr:translation initiation factor IF-2 [Solirubrobacteraceae bacterium]
MSKKRVHEIAKEHGLSSKELLERLQAGGVSAKAAASSVEEADALRVLAGNGASAGATATATATKTAPPAPPPANGAPKPPVTPTTPAQSTPSGQATSTDSAVVDQAPTSPAPPTQSTAAEGAAADGTTNPDAAAGQAAGERVRPTRDSRTGERTPASNSAGGRRRVVIDSQASRRQQGGPANQPVRRPRRGRRRRGTYDETIAPIDTTAMEATDLIRVNSGSTVKDVAEYLGVPVPEVIKKLMMLGEMATLTQTLSDDAIQVLADEFEKKIEIVHAADDVEVEPVFEDDEQDLVDRPPVVTIMGHVDHGKTSLLDAIRQTEVAAGEAGGITQHIGAYQVHHGEKVITFLDTPGHEAFTAMRARGAQVTDLAVIVVAADDGVKPQTEEAIDHAKAAEVPIVVAVNKIDKEGAQPERVRTELTQLGLQPAEWGGETEFVDVSAKTREGLDSLLEMIQVVTDLEELKANRDVTASGTVIESKLDPGRGPVVSILIQRGTLQVGDALVAGASFGRVRAMHNFVGARVKTAEPGEPVEVLGFDGVPEAGEFVRVVENERRARQLAGERANRLKTEALARRSGRKVSLEDVFKLAQEGTVKELSLVIKADVAGSLEAIEDEIAKLPQDEVSVNIIHRGVGGINESDVMLASASSGLILAFNVRPVGDARQLADREGVEIRSYSVIYRAIEELRAAMQGMLEPTEVETSLGQAEVRQLFKASRIGTIAGSHVSEGKVTRGARVRVVREGTVIYDTTIASLRRFNEDAREVSAGFECGIVLTNFQDLREGDILETYETRLQERQLA